MLYVVIILLIGIVLTFIIDYIHTNKEKIFNIFTQEILIKRLKIENKEVKKCYRCKKKYENLELQICPKCNQMLCNKKIYIVPEKLKQKLLRILIILIFLILIMVTIYLIINNYIKEKEKIEKYYNDLDKCYSSIQELNWKRADNIIREHSEEKEFEELAYKKLYETLDENIENIKNGINDKKILEKIEYISNETIDDKIKNKFLIAKLYTKINEVNSIIQNQEYEKAYKLLNEIINEAKEKEDEIYNMAKNRQEEIRDSVLQEVLSKAKKEYKNKEYQNVMTTLNDYIDLGNNDIKDLYNKAKKEKEKIEEEERKKEEEEQKKQEEKERVQREKELKAKKDKLTINRNGKKIWKVCMTGSEFRFQAKYRGNGIFIVRLLDDNQNLEELICNEIGDYNVDKTVYVKEGHYYYIETRVSDGRWNGTWWGTYGD